MQVALCSYVQRVRVHDLHHTYGQRLRDAGVSEEDQALLLAHAIDGMPQHYATATVARLVDAANRVAHTVDRTMPIRLAHLPTTYGVSVEEERA